MDGLVPSTKVAASFTTSQKMGKMNMDSQIKIGKPIQSPTLRVCLCEPCRSRIHGWFGAIHEGGSFLYCFQEKLVKLDMDLRRKIGKRIQSLTLRVCLRAFVSHVGTNSMDDLVSLCAIL